MSRTLILAGRETEDLSSLAGILSRFEANVSTTSLHNPPALAEAIRAGAASGAGQIVLVPCVLHLAKTDRDALLRQIETLQPEFPDTPIRLADPIGLDPRLAEIITDRADQAGLDESAGVPILKVDGLVPESVALTYRDLCELPGQIPDVARLAPGRRGAGIRARALLDRSGIQPGATHAVFHAADDGFSADVRLEPLRENGFFIYQIDGRPLPPGQGGPLRLLIPGIDDRCANVKNVVRIELVRKTGTG